MLKLVSFVSLLFLLVSAEAQNHHFVYFESQNNKPFIIKYENKIYSNTKKNYVNLTKLNNGINQIKIDIENEKDLNFTIPINDNDAGFILKQDANNDWILFDILNFTNLLQDMFIQNIVVNKQTSIIEPTAIIETTKFIEPIIEKIDSTPLIQTPKSNLIPTPILLDTLQKKEDVNITKETNKKTQPTDTITIFNSSTNDTLIALRPLTSFENNVANTKTELKKDSLIENVAIIEEKVQTKLVEKIHQVQLQTGIEQMYVDRNGGSIDTISIFIPIKNTVKADTVKEVVRPIVEEKKMISKNIDVAQLNEVNCAQIATEYDFNNFILKLQKSPVIKTKLSIASTVLKDKCYTTSQIQRLAVLFLYDKAKLEFFKIAISSIADIRNFHYLGNEIKDESMKQEFSELIKP